MVIRPYKMCRIQFSIWYEFDEKTREQEKLRCKLRISIIQVSQLILMRDICLRLAQEMGVSLEDTFWG